METFLANQRNMMHSYQFHKDK